jgi:hypothetical protein
MPDIADRLAKRKAARTQEVPILLDEDLLPQLAELEQERQRIIDQAGDDEPDTADVDARIEAKKAEIEAETLRLFFKPVSSDRYDELLGLHPEVDESEAELRAFLDTLADEGLHAVYLNGEKQAVQMSKIRPLLTGGDIIQIRDVVWVLNRRQAPSIPFSFSSSPTTQ